MVQKIIDERKVEEFVSIIRSLSSSDRAVIIHDYDADGITSALLVRNLLRDRGVPVVELVSNVNRAHMLGEENRKRILAANPTIIFSTDLDLQTLQGFDELFNVTSVRFVIQDHHTVNPLYAAMPRVLYVNPIEMADHHDGSQYCSAKFIYDLASAVQDMSKYMYLACLGILGDNNAKSWGDFLLAFVAQEGLKVHVDVPEDWYNTVLTKPMSLIFCATAVDNDAFQNVVKIFGEANSFADLVAAAQRNPYDYVQKELNMYVKNYKEFLDARSTDTLHIVRVESQYHIASVLCTIISQKEAESIWVTAHPQGDFMRISTRNQSSTYHLGKLMRDLCSRFDQGNGGGHIPASAGRVLVKDFDAFLSLLKENLLRFKING